MENTHATIKDVARRAGVAVSTVSRVINGLDRVSSETRERVLRAVDELDYSQNRLAVSMITGETKAILIMIPDFINPFYAALVQGAEDALRREGYMVFVCSTGDDDSEPLLPVLKRFQENIDAAVIIPSGHSASELAEFPKPVVFVDRTVRGGGISVTADDRKGAYMLTKELLTHGHRRIGFITGKRELNVCAEREAGYLDALHEAGISPDKGLIFHDSMYERAGYRCTESLLTLPSPPTAIFAGNNLICVGCIRAVMDANMRIGEDISIAGFDDHPVAATLHPGITVVTRPPVLMGREAAELLMKWLKTREAPGSIVTQVELIRRGSIRDV